MVILPWLLHPVPMAARRGTKLCAALGIPTLALLGRSIPPLEHRREAAHKILATSTNNLAHIHTRRLGLWRHPSSKLITASIPVHIPKAWLRPMIPTRLRIPATTSMPCHGSCLSLTTYLVTHMVLCTTTAVVRRGGPKPVLYPYRLCQSTLPHCRRPARQWDSSLVTRKAILPRILPALVPAHLPRLRVGAQLLPSARRVIPRFLSPASRNAPPPTRLDPKSTRTPKVRLVRPRPGVDADHIIV
jgi:hypothetical protein